MKKMKQVPFKFAIPIIFILCFIFLPIKNHKSGLSISYSYIKDVISSKKESKGESKENIENTDEEKLKSILK